MSLTCDHRRVYGVDVSAAKKSPPHEMCAACQEISLPERTADHWTCCVCLRQNFYNKERRRAAVKRAQRFCGRNLEWL